MSRVLIVIGTRPNFIKVTQFKMIVAENYSNIDLKIVHTGQHYDNKMADVFFEQFSLQPDFYLQVKADSPIKQMASIMVKLEDLIDTTFYPDLIIVPGDVNSTLAAALVANKIGIKLAHLESGLRSKDKEMPEEWNRLLVDEMADYYFITEKSGKDYLEEEQRGGKSYFVGNTMIDTMVAFENEIQKSTITKDLGLEQEQFVLMTIHRPSNVDTKEGLETLLGLLKFLEGKLKVVFPIHPRTFARISEFGLEKEFDSLDNLISTEPLSYFDFQKLIASCTCVLTDSGGIQEETTFRQVPCLTLRENTERPVTITEGTNTLVPFELEIIQEHLEKIINGDYKPGIIPKYWDGKATERILEILDELL